VEGVGVGSGLCVGSGVGAVVSCGAGVAEVVSSACAGRIDRSRYINAAPNKKVIRLKKPDCAADERSNFKKPLGIFYLVPLKI
jgi:hypothetical protein